jgi:predicted metal-dependent peptidase
MKLSVSKVGTAPDTSASIGKELTRAMSEMKFIFEDIQPDEVDMMYWDTEVTGHETYQTHQVRDIHTVTKPTGGGGTDPSCVFRYVKDKQLDLDCLILFTDGYVHSWGKDIGIPTLWCVINNDKAVAPFGKTIHVEV